jgi:uncharacterized protein (DUF983 family)
VLYLKYAFLASLAGVLALSGVCVTKILMPHPFWKEIILVGPLTIVLGCVILAAIAADVKEKI